MIKTRGAQLGQKILYSKIDFILKMLKIIYIKLMSIYGFKLVCNASLYTIFGLLHSFGLAEEGT